MGSQPRGISASRAAAILGLGEYEGQTVFTEWQLICEERRPGFNAERGYLMPVHGDELEAEKAHIRWGHAFEDAIVELASAAQGQKITDREMPFSLIDQGMEYVTCHVDGRYSLCVVAGPDYSARPILHEGKTTSLFAFWDAWGEPGTDRVPSGYQVQVQHQMLCTGASEAIVSVLVFPRRPDEWEREGICVGPMLMGGHRFLGEHQGWSLHDWARVIAEMGLFHQYPVAAKPELQREMLERYRHFWATYVIPEREPPIDCYPDMLRAFPAPVGTIVCTEQEAAWLAERKMITEEIGDTSPLAKRKKELARLTLESVRSRIGQAVIDEESQDKVVFVDGQGKKLGQYDGKTFR